MPYLKSELPIRIPSDTAFNAEMTTLHPDIKPRSKTGFMYRHMVVHAEKFHWNDILDFKNDPAAQQKLQFLKSMEDIDNKVKTVSLPDTRRKSVDAKIISVQKEMRNDIKRGSPGITEVIKYQNVQFNPMYMAPIYQNAQWMAKMQEMRDNLAAAEFKKQAHPRAIVPEDDYFSNLMCMKKWIP